MTYAQNHKTKSLSFDAEDFFTNRRCMQILREAKNGLCAKPSDFKLSYTVVFDDIVHILIASA